MWSRKGTDDKIYSQGSVLFASSCQFFSMVTRSRLKRKSNSMEKNRLKIVLPELIRVTKKTDSPPKKGEVELRDRHLWSVEEGDNKFGVGFYGKANQEDFELLSKEPPYIRFTVPQQDAEYVKIDWKTRKLYDLFNGNFIGKIPKDVELEKYEPVNILGKHPKTVIENELDEFKKQAKIANEERKVDQIFRELKIDQKRTKSLLQRIKEGTYP